MRVAEVDASRAVGRKHLEREAISNHRFLAFANGFHEEPEVVERVRFAFHRGFGRGNDAVEKRGGFVAFCGFSRPALDAHPNVEQHVSVFGRVF